MKNFERLFTKVTEITDEFKQYLAEHIQEVLETLMQDKWFISFSATYKHYQLTEENDTTLWDYQ